MARNAASSRDTPIEKPVAGTGSARKRATKAIVAPATTDRAETDLTTHLVSNWEGQLRLEDGAGVIFEPAHDGGIDANYGLGNRPLSVNLASVAKLVETLIVLRPFEASAEAIRSSMHCSPRREQSPQH